MWRISESDMWLTKKATETGEKKCDLLGIQWDQLTEIDWKTGIKSFR